jgi:hypothetical protein
MTGDGDEAPRWAPDPTGLFAQRYWDGTQWTPYVSGREGGAPRRDSTALPPTLPPPSAGVLWSPRTASARPAELSAAAGAVAIPTRSGQYAVHVAASPAPATEVAIPGPEPTRPKPPKSGRRHRFLQIAFIVCAVVVTGASVAFGLGAFTK